MKVGALFFFGGVSSASAFLPGTNSYFRSTQSRPLPSRPLMAVNNVVLAPSTDPKLFDSFAIGSPKIHCYQRDGGGEDEYEYVMWFSGRDKATYTGVDENGNKNEIDGTGGSFGRATSKNGLHWQRAEGSYEELPGVVLGLNKESWWGFDTGGFGCATIKTVQHQVKPNKKTTNQSPVSHRRFASLSNG